jgi:glyoxylase-like metal-dependent hydrolase (beta-lactamase superfamily II)
MARRRSTMTRQWTRRQVLAQAGIAAAVVYTLDPHELCCGVNAYAQTASEEKFALKKVGDGIWAAVAEVRYKVNSNAAVIETNDGIVIVDTHSKPSAARSLYKEIQAVSKKPVRKIINTHFHWDHWQGNEVYLSANPGLEIITTEQTKQNLTTPDVGVGGVPFIEKQLAALPGEIAKLKDDIQKAPNAEVKGRLQSNLAQAEAYFQELKQIKPALPTRTVSKTVTLQEGGREIQLHVLGRGHTNGDLYIYMPKEKVVATGDAVVDWMPFLNDGYPEEWAQTVAALEKLDIVQIIPGHGEPAPKAHLVFFRGYLTDLVAAVKTAAAGGATLDEMKTKVADQLAPKYEKGMSRYPVGQFRDRIGLNVEMVHKKVVAKS